MFNLYEIGRDWNEQGTLISSHQTCELAEKRMMKEIKKRVDSVYYVRKTVDETKKEIIFDYGLWNKFFVIREEAKEEKSVTISKTAILERAYELACMELNELKKRSMSDYVFTAIDEMNAFKLLAKESLSNE